MKNFKTIRGALRSFLTLVVLSFFQTAVWAQDDKKVDINVNTKSENWYAQPWVWIVGGAVFILLLVALLRGGGNKD